MGTTVPKERLVVDFVLALREVFLRLLLISCVRALAMADTVDGPPDVIELSSFNQFEHLRAAMSFCKSVSSNLLAFRPTMTPSAPVTGSTSFKIVRSCRVVTPR